MQGYEKVKEKLAGALGALLGETKAALSVVEGRQDGLDALKGCPPVAVVSFDVDRIKDFVFASASPLEIQGASAVVKELEEDGKILNSSLQHLGLHAGSVVFAGGGNGLLIVPADAADELAQELRRRFRETTGVGTCSVVWHVFRPEELITGPTVPAGLQKLTAQGGLKQVPGAGFGAVLAFMADLMREAKEERADILLPPLPGYLRRCDSCGREAATKEDRVRRAAARDRLCGHCLCKRERGREERQALEGQGLETALTIEEIAGREEGAYYAVVYADGNGVGQALFRLPGLMDCAVFARALRRVLDTSVQELVTEHGLKGRYQAPVLGGDDLVLLVPARRAAAVVRDILRGLPDRLKKEGDRIGGEAGSALKGVTFSAGFVIVRKGFPMRFALDYAEALLLSAKRAPYTGYDHDIQQAFHNKQGAFVDWMVVKDASPLTTSVEVLRQTVLCREGGLAVLPLRLTAKPVTAQELERLLADVGALRETVPRHQLHQVEQLLLTEALRAIPLQLRYQFVRLDSWRRFFGKRYPGEMLASAVEEWLQTGAFKLEKAALAPFYQTNLLDLIELYEFTE
jgi:hypothetical protein